LSQFHIELEHEAIVEQFSSTIIIIITGAWSSG